jgi:hypothetical protein
MDIVAEPRGTPEYDKIMIAFPETKDGVAAVFFKVLKQGFVEGEILYWRGQGEVEQAE